MPINRKKFANTLGTFAAFMHLIWVILVALNWAQPLSNFVHKMHFLSPSSDFLPFNFLRAIGLIVLAYIVAYIIGTIFATIWNKIHAVHMPAQK